MSERILLIPGRSGAQAISGVLCETESPATTAALFWNAGLLHHVGPNRLFVQMARAFSQAGVPSYRFDVSGLGDSAVRTGASAQASRAIGEIREVMDFLEKNHGCKRFVLVGLCSGADEAHRVAVADARVAAAVHLDGYFERTPRYFVEFAAKRVLQPAKWKRLFEIAASRAGSAADAPVEVFERDFPSPKEVRSDLRRLVDRGARLLYLYTGGLKEYAYESQFNDMFRDLDFKGRVESGYFREADHLYSDPAVRRKMIERVVTWLRGIPLS